MCVAGATCEWEGQDMMGRAVCEWEGQCVNGRGNV